MEEGRFMSRTGGRELAVLVAVSARQRGRVLGWLLAGGLPALLLSGMAPLSVARGTGLGPALLLHGLAAGAALLLGQWLERRARARTVARLRLVAGPLPWEVSWDAAGIEVRNLAGRTWTPWRRVATLAVAEGTVVLLVSPAESGRGRGGFAFPARDLPDGTLGAWQGLVGGHGPERRSPPEPMGEEG